MARWRAAPGDFHERAQLVELRAAAEIVGMRLAHPRSCSSCPRADTREAVATSMRLRVDAVARRQEAVLLEHLRAAPTSSGGA